MRRGALSTIGIGAVAVAAAVAPGGGAHADGGEGTAAGDSVVVRIYAGAPGAAAAGGAAIVTHRRTLELPAGRGEVRFAGVAARLDPATVRFRSLADPRVMAVEQRFADDMASLDALLGRYEGQPIAVVTGRGEVQGRLRAWNDRLIVLEGSDGALRALRRGDYVQDVRFAAPAEPLFDRPTLVWQVDGGKGGRQPVEVSYRTAGLAWSADYTAIVDEARGTIDLSAWATIRNGAGVDFDGARIVLVSGGLDAAAPAQVAVAGPVLLSVPASLQAPQQPAGGAVASPGQAVGAPAVAGRGAGERVWSYAIEQPARITDGSSLQLELFTPVTGAPARRVVVYEPLPDQSAQYVTYPATDCYGYYAPAASAARSDVYLELAAGDQRALPEGQVRLFRRNGEATELVSEERVRPNLTTGMARVRIAADGEIGGERRQVECRFDDRARQVRERIEVKLRNRGKKPVEVVLREYLYRWGNWTIEAEDAPGSRASGSAQEYRVKVPAGGERAVTYTVLYSW
jgi:hypothetical protein